MGKLIMWNIITLDGYFEGEEKWDLPFHQTVWGPEMEQFSLEQLAQTAYLVFGRITYEGMFSYWRTAEGAIADYMNSLPKLVCSRTMTTAEWNNSQLLKENVAEAIASFKAKSSKDLFVFGSAHLSETLAAANLFDEYRIGIAPVIAGKGNLLFPKGFPERDLKLMSTQTFSTGAVVLKYQA